MRYIRNRIFFLTENKQQSKSIINRLSKGDMKMITNLFLSSLNFGLSNGESPSVVKFMQEAKDKMNEISGVSDDSDIFYDKLFEFIYDKLIELCSSKPNLLGLFTNFLFIDKIPFNNLIDLMGDLEEINIKDLPKDILKYNSNGKYIEGELDPFEKLTDDILLVKKKYILRKFRQTLNSKQKNEFDEIKDYKKYIIEDGTTTIDILNIVNDFSKKYPFSMIKVSKFDTLEELISFVLLATLKDIKDIDDLVHLLRSSGVEVMDRDDNLVVARIKTYEESSKYGSENWCISYDETHFNSYVLSETWNRQYFIWNYDKLGSNLFMTGVTVNADLYKVDNFVDFILNVTAHDEYDDEIVIKDGTPMVEWLKKDVVSDALDKLDYLVKLYNEGIFNFDDESALEACGNNKENYIIQNQYDDGYDGHWNFISPVNGVYTATNRFGGEDGMLVTNINNIQKGYGDIIDVISPLYSLNFVNHIYTLESVMGIDMSDFIDSLYNMTGIKTDIDEIIDWMDGEITISGIYNYTFDIKNMGEEYNFKFMMFVSDYIIKYVDKLDSNTLRYEIEHIKELHKLSDLFNRNEMKDIFIVKNDYLKVYQFSSEYFSSIGEDISVVIARDIIGSDKFIIVEFF